MATLLPDIMAIMALLVGLPTEPSLQCHKEWELLQGRWEIQRAVMFGDQMSQSHISFKGDVIITRQSILDGEDFASAATYVIDWSSTPRRIDIRTSAGQSYLGVFELRGDTLTLCWSVSGTERPHGFWSKKRF